MVAFKRTGRVAGGLLLLSLAACGGRTGELDGYDSSTGSSLPGDDGGKGATSSGASTSTGASSSTGATTSSGGSTSTGGGTSTAGSTQAGAPSQGGGPSTGGSAGVSGGFGQAGSATAGAGGLSGSKAVACADLCLDPSSPCPDQFGPGVQCANDCLAALSVQNGACESVGAQLAFCVKDAAQKFGTDCSTGASQAPLICAGLLQAYQACASGNVTGPVPPPTACSGGGSAAPGKCYLNQMCSDGSYFNVTCYEQGESQSNCTCTTGSVTANITLNESAIYACNDAMVACNGPILPK